MARNSKNSLKQSRPRSRHIGFFAPTGSEYCNRLAEGMLQYQAEHRHCVIRDFRYDALEPEDRERWARRPRPWEAWPADGLIVHISADPGLAEWIAAGGRPFVNTGPAPAYISAVYISSSGTVDRAVEYFRSCGITNLAFVTQLQESRLQERFEARLKKDGDLPRCVALGINSTDWDFSDEETAAKDPGLVQMLCTAPKPLGVLAHNDEVGRVVCQAALRLGLDIPGDVAVLGVNDSALSRSAVPPLSSIHIPAEAVGYRAMQVVECLLDGLSTPLVVEIPPGQVMIRESTAMSHGTKRQGDIVRARQMIRDRACEGVQIAQIIAELNLSRSKLQRDFLEAFGHSPLDELARVRLERAQHLLATTELPIGRIAELVGYANPTSFNGFFRTQTGMSPSDYRAARRGD